MEPSDTPAPGGAPTNTPPPTGQGFFTWLRGVGITRSSDERWFTGVAGGIAARAGIDPLIVRGVFVVLAVLGGSGVLIYLAAWLLLPNTAGTIHVEEMVQGRAAPGVVIAGVIVALVIVVPVLIGVVRSVFGGPGEWWLFNLLGAPEWVTVTFTVLWWAVLVPAGVVVLVLWLIRRSARGTTASSAPDGAGASTASTASGATPGTDWAGQATAAAQNAAQTATEWGEKAGAQATEWGEKVSAQGATLSQKIDAQTTEWEAKMRTHHEQTSLGAGHIVLTLALSLLAAGGVAVWALSTAADTSVVWLLALVAFIVICSGSMIVAGIRGKYSGWVGFLAFAGVIALLFTPLTTVLPNDMKVVLLGESHITVDQTTPNETGVVSLAGNVTVDLTQLDEYDAGHTVEVWMVAGSVEVQLPEDHPTRVNIQILAGNTSEDLPGRDSRTTVSPFQFHSIGANLEGAAPSDVTEVRVRMIAGSVDVLGEPATHSNQQNNEVNR